MVHDKVPASKSTERNTDGTHRINYLNGTKVRVDKIHVDGLARTKDDIIKVQVTELFKAKNFEDVVTLTHRVYSRLQALECFKNIWVHIDTSQGQGRTSNGVEVTFNVHELSPIGGEVNTMVGNNEGSVLVGLRARNLFGRAERMSMEYSRGSKSTTNFNVSAVKPFIRRTSDSVLTGSVFSTASDFPWSGYKQNDKGILIDFRLPTSSNSSGTLTHTWQYEAVFRQIAAVRRTSFDVREQCGPSLKSAFRHISTLDKRDSSLFPSRGNLFKFSTEIAGLGGNIGFLKNELTLQSNWSPHKLFTFQLGIQAGLLRSIDNNFNISITDRFFLGGPMSLRGFDTRGCGPRSDGCSLGGDAYWASALHLYTPLPFTSPKNTFSKQFKLHGFINCGNLSNFTFQLGKNYEENLKIFTQNVRCSIGAGIAMEIGGQARIELNFVHPLLFVRSDVLRQFQFGIGIEYL